MEILDIPLRAFEKPLKNFNFVIVSQKLKHIKNLSKLENIYKLREKDNNTYKNEECAICLKNIPQVLYCNCGHLSVCKICFYIIEEENRKKCVMCNRINETIKYNKNNS